MPLLINPPPIWVEALGFRLMKPMTKIVTTAVLSTVVNTPKIVKAFTDALDDKSPTQPSGKSASSTDVIDPFE